MTKPTSATPRFEKTVIAKRVKEARETRTKMTTEDLAAATGIGAESLYKKQQGKTPFSVEQLARVRDALDAPSLFPLLDWEEAVFVDKMLALIPSKK